MSYLETAAAAATIVVPVMGLLIGLQTFWIARTLDRIEQRLDRIEQTVIHDHGERLTRLEEWRKNLARAPDPSQRRAEDA